MAARIILIFLLSSPAWAANSVLQTEPRRLREALSLLVKADRSADGARRLAALEALRAGWPRAPLPLGEALDEVSSALMELEKSKIFPLDTIGALNVIAARWLTEVDPATIPARPLRRWLGIAGRVVRDGVYMHAIAPVYLRLDLGLKTLDHESVQLLGSLCHFWVIRGEPATCATEVELFRGQAAGRPEILRALAFHEARLQNLTGHPTEGIRALEKIVPEVLEPAEHLLPWIYFSLAEAQLNQGNLPETDKYLKKHRASMRGYQGKRWAGKMGDSLEVSRMVFAGQYRTAGLRAARLQREFRQNVRGPMEVHAWLALDRLAAAALLNDTHLMNRAAADIDTEIAALPDLGFIATFAQALRQAQAKKPYAVEVDTLKKKLGAGYPAIKRLEALLARFP